MLVFERLVLVKGARRRAVTAAGPPAALGRRVCRTGTDWRSPACSPCSRRADAEALETAFALPSADDVHVIGITGAPGAGKSTLIDALAARLRAAGTRVGVLAVDPSSPYSGRSAAG